jgi:hypothetical protein
MRRRTSISPVGGTTLENSGGGLPIVPLVLAIVVGGGIIAFFAFRGHGSKASAEPQTPEAETVHASSATVASTSPAAAVAPEAAPAKANGPKPDALAAELERQLKKQRLWSTVNIVGDHVDVRSGACKEPSMQASLGAMAGSFKAAGLTRIRCLEQSGAVVLDRDL